MPKVLSSSSRRVRAHHHPTAHPLQSAPASHAPILLSTPRKVSFEDGHHSSSGLTFAEQTNSCSTSSSSIASSLSSSKSSLRRKAPSVCLVGLANTDEEEARQCLSPTPQDMEEATSSSPSSPWGHFVDMLVSPDEDDEQPCHKRRLVGDNPPLFGGFFQPAVEEALAPPSPTFGLVLHKNKRRRRWAAPYGLQPRQTARRSQQLKPSFLPGFFLPTAATDETQEVEQALQHLQV